MLKRFLISCLLATIGLSFNGAVLAKETYVVGSGGTYRPFEFENSHKQLEGFDIDLIKAIAKSEDFDIKLINTPWEGLFASLKDGERDMIISGITITDKRKLSMDFSHPYFPAEQVIIIPENSRVNSLNDLKDKQVVGVVTGSTGDTAASTLLGQNSQKIRRFDNSPIMLQELYEGGIDAAIGDVGVIKYYIKTHPSKPFKLVNDNNFATSYFGIAVAKNNKALLNKINDGLKQIISDGTYAKIYEKWFDKKIPNLPSN